MFFENEFNQRQFNDTKEQVVRRIYGILENATFDRMMSNPRNKVDFFTAMQEGKIIIVNTAQNFLMAQGTLTFGRFIIAMIRQAVQERATERDNLPCYVYIDEFADYLSGGGEDSVEQMLTQARKFNVGLTLSHQYMGQLTPKLQQAIASNTSTKLVGGVSPSDARLLAPMLRTSPEFILDQSKGHFATYAKGQTETAVSLKIEFGVMERLPKTADIRKVREYMRATYGADKALPPPTKPENPESPWSGKTPPPEKPVAPKPQKPPPSPKIDDDAPKPW